MSGVLVAVDLDQTLVFSPRAAARGPERPSRVVEVLDGRTISLLSEATEQGLVELARAAVVVPTTTRTRAQYERVDLPLTPRYAVVASGAGILVDGQPDLEWAQGVARRLAGESASVAELRDVLGGYGDREWLLRLRDADDVFLVAQVDADRLHAEELNAVTDSCGTLGWRAVHQGRKLYVLPNGLDKAAAVAEVARRVGGSPAVVAAGDTGLDQAMLEAASHGWFPAGSELDRIGFCAPHVTRTAEPGLAAAEEIVAGCLAWAQTRR